MGFGIDLRDNAARIELINSERFVQITFQHGDAIAGKSTHTFPASMLAEFASSFRVLAAHAGQPLKASWEADFLKQVFDHDPETDIGRPSTPPRTHTTSAP